jgi:predicted transcriptional regulator YdeE
MNMIAGSHVRIQHREIRGFHGYTNHAKLIDGAQKNDIIESYKRKTMQKLKQIIREEDIDIGGCYFDYEIVSEGPYINLFAYLIKIDDDLLHECRQRQHHRR